MDFSKPETDASFFNSLQKCIQANIQILSDSLEISEKEQIKKILLFLKEKGQFQIFGGFFEDLQDETNLKTKIIENLEFLTVESSKLLKGIEQNANKNNISVFSKLLFEFVCSLPFEKFGCDGFTKLINLTGLFKNNGFEMENAINGLLLNILNKFLTETEDKKTVESDYYLYIFPGLIDSNLFNEKSDQILIIISLLTIKANIPTSNKLFPILKVFEFIVQNNSCYLSFQELTNLNLIEILLQEIKFILNNWQSSNEFDKHFNEIFLFINQLASSGVDNQYMLFKDFFSDLTKADYFIRLLQLKGFKLFLENVFSKLSWFQTKNELECLLNEINLSDKKFNLEEIQFFINLLRIICCLENNYFSTFLKFVQNNSQTSKLVNTEEIFIIFSSKIKTLKLDETIKSFISLSEFYLKKNDLSFSENHLLRNFLKKTLTEKAFIEKSLFNKVFCEFWMNKGICLLTEEEIIENFELVFTCHIKNKNYFFLQELFNFIGSYFFTKEVLNNLIKIFLKTVNTNYVVDIEMPDINCSNLIMRVLLAFSCIQLSENNLRYLLEMVWIILKNKLISSLIEGSFLILNNLIKNYPNKNSFLLHYLIRIGSYYPEIYENALSFLSYKKGEEKFFRLFLNKLIDICDSKINAYILNTDTFFEKIINILKEKVFEQEDFHLLFRLMNILRDVRMTPQKVQSILSKNA